MSSIHTIEDALLTTYLFVSDFLSTHPRLAQWRRSPNAHPVFTDAEVLTIALMQGCLECSTLKKAYLHIKHNHQDAFPHLISYPRWLARLHALSFLTGHLLPAALASQRGIAPLYVIDTKPIPVCKLVRAARVRLLREDGAYWGKSSTGWYFGFKLHAIHREGGGLVAVLLTPANISDLDPDVVTLLCSHLSGGVLLGDEGYQSRPLRRFLSETTDMELRIARDFADKADRRGVHQIRKRIETTFSQLWRQWLDRVFSRSFAGLWSTLLLKMVHHNLRIAKVLT